MPADRREVEQNWHKITELIEDSYRMTAPKILLRPRSQP
jgi:hypothetical protein